MAGLKTCWCTASYILSVVMPNNALQADCRINCTSQWVGIAVGVDLLNVERKNGKPFRLRGYGTDGSGWTRSWGGGRLESVSECSLSLRLDIDWNAPRSSEDDRLLRQLRGEGTFSSGHPAFQRMNPKVGSIRLTYEPPNISLQRARVDKVHPSRPHCPPAELGR
jgi:hypothetical protein